ncbi:hypothetical protein F5Y11DRAFT_320148 [Daldinia sp. FL1419]|nr:hypothetical protein F5Y11DRAFT_320148 [Daldinia sp. FL1419]
MVEMRSGAQAPAKGHIPDREQRQQHSPSPKNTDSDEDEIPYILSPNRSIDPPTRSLDHRRNRSRDDDLSIQFGPSKRRKTGPLSNSGNACLYPTPTSPVTKRPGRTTHSRKAAKSLSPEDAVPPGLVSSLNAAFKRKKREEHQRLLPPTDSQLKNGIIGSRGNEKAQGNAQGNAQANHNQNINPQGFQDHDATNESGRGKSPVAIGDHEGGDESDIAPDNNDVVPQSLGEVQSQVDIWDVPASPIQEALLKQSNGSDALEELPLRVRRIEVHIPRRGPRPTQPSQPRESLSSKNPRSTPDGDRNDSLEPKQPRRKSSTENRREQEGAGPALEPVGQPSSDDENLSEFDFSEESFAQDVARFRARYPKGYKGSETFQPLEEDDSVSIHIDSSCLKKALRLMGHEAWSGKGRKWHERPFRFDYMQPGSVRALLKFLTKFERLLVAAPKAPRITEQNIFFNEHSDLFGYYFSKIKLIIRRIRKIMPAKEGPSQSQRGKEAENYDEILRDSASLAIPMLFHVLASVWWLGGGRHRLRSSFTVSTIELLMRTLGWIGLLYRPLLRTLKQQPPEDGEEEEETEAQRKKRLLKREKREELEVLFNELKRLVGDGPDILETEERRQNQERRTHQERLKQLEGMKVQQKRDEETLMIPIQERQWRSLMSIRGIHIPLSESRIPASTRGSSTQEMPRIQPSPTTIAWSTEEKIYLFKKIQESYPDLPDLDDIRWELNRTLNDTEAMAEELLGQMLEAVRPQQPAEDRNAHIQEIMQNYRRTWGH